LQGYEKIDNGFVFYSLGNFAFAPLKQGDENDLDPYRHKKSIILHYKITSSSVTIEWDPIFLDKMIVYPIRKIRIKGISKLLPIISNPITWPFYRFYLNVIYKAWFYFFGNGRKPFKRLGAINTTKIQRALDIITFKN